MSKQHETGPGVAASHTSSRNMSAGAGLSIEVDQPAVLSAEGHITVSASSSSMQAASADALTTASLLSGPRPSRCDSHQQLARCVATTAASEISSAGSSGSIDHSRMHDRPAAAVDLESAQLSLGTAALTGHHHHGASSPGRTLLNLQAQSSAGHISTPSLGPRTSIRRALSSSARPFQALHVKFQEPLQDSALWQHQPESRLARTCSALAAPGKPQHHNEPVQKAQPVEVSTRDSNSSCIGHSLQAGPVSDSGDDTDAADCTDDIRAASTSQAMMARMKLLQEMAQQRELQRMKLLRSNMLRWKLNHAAYTASKHLKQTMRRMSSAQLPADTQPQQADGGWSGENGEAESVSTAVQQRLHSLQAKLVPTAIEQQQEVRKLLKDRNQGILPALRSLWDDYKLAQRLRKLASSSRSAAAATGTDTVQSKFRDPLAHGNRVQAGDTLLKKLPDWIVGFRPGFNPEADQFWLEQQWQFPPFSTALADAEEQRRQREGAGWSGGPKTEQGLLAFEDLQLHHMLAEQRRALVRVRSRRLVAWVPGLGFLQKVPLTEVLGTYGPSSAAATPGVMISASAAAAALRRTISALMLLIEQRRSAAAGAASINHTRSSATHADSKRRMLHGELMQLRKQHQQLLMRDTLPVLEAQQHEKHFMEVWGAVAAPTVVTTHVQSPTRHVGVASPHPAPASTGQADVLTSCAGHSDGGQGYGRIRYDVAQLKAQGLLDAAAQLWSRQHESDLLKLQQIITTAEGTAGRGDTLKSQGGPRACPSDLQPSLSQQLEGNASCQQMCQQAQTEQRQQQQQVLGNQVPLPVGKQREGLETRSRQSTAGQEWLNKYAHRMKAQVSQASATHPKARKKQLEALSELNLGVPIWHDAAAIGPLGHAEVSMAALCLR